MPIFYVATPVVLTTPTATSVATNVCSTATTTATTSTIGWSNATTVSAYVAPSLWQVQGQALMAQQAAMQQANIQAQQRLAQWHPYREPTPEEAAIIERENAAATERAVVGRRQVEEATTRARTLLLSFLSLEQRREFEMAGSFIVIGKSGTRYRIRRGHVGNVDVLRKGDDYVVQRLCFHPSNDNELPVYDTMLAQMLHLRDDDAAARRIANVHH